MLQIWGHGPWFLDLGTILPKDKFLYCSAGTLYFTFLRCFYLLLLVATTVSSTYATRSFRNLFVT